VVHHSDTKVDATTGARLHPGDYAVREIFALGALVLTGAPLSGVGVFSSNSLKKFIPFIVLTVSSISHVYVLIVSLIRFTDFLAFQVFCTFRKRIKPDGLRR
jgi:hypothetical protein